MVLCDFTVQYGTIIRDSNKNRSIQKVDRGNNKQNWMKLKQDGTEPKRRTMSSHLRIGMVALCRESTKGKTLKYASLELKKFLGTNSKAHKMLVMIVGMSHP